MEEEKRKKSLYDIYEAGIKSTTAKIELREKTLREMIKAQKNQCLKSLMEDLYLDPLNYEFITPSDLVYYGPDFVKFIKKLVKFCNFKLRILEKYENMLTNYELHHEYVSDIYYMIDDFIFELKRDINYDEMDIDNLSSYVDDMLDEISIMHAKNDKAFVKKLNQQFLEDEDRAAVSLNETDKADLEVVEDFLNKKPSDDENA